MNPLFQSRSILAPCVAAFVLVGPSAASCAAPADAGQSAREFSQVDALGLPPVTAAQLKDALKARDYIAAEKSLLTEIQRDPHSPQAAGRLQFLGGVYFLDHDDWNAAIAWNKAKAIRPLPPTVSFSLAMAYIRIGHADWARATLKALAAADSGNALYPYWLGRLDYDADHYDRAIQHFQKAVQLAPDMAQAYNNLGLCYARQNRNQEAVASYHKAIALERKAGHPDAWTYLNLAVTERALNQRGEAEAHLREAIRLDPKFALAHFQLGNLLEEAGKTKAAIQEFQDAARLDPNYAEPHYALARVYRKLGNTAASKREVKSYRRIQSHPKAQADASSTPSHP